MTNRKPLPAGRAERPAPSRLAEAAAEHQPVGFLAGLREWMDALMIAFVLAMFIRTFVVELFKIPSGSMTPTLLGDFVAEGVAVDRQGQSQAYLLVQNRQDAVQVFRKDSGGNYRNEGIQPVSLLSMSQRDLLERERHLEEHRILVNKFSYWFKPPERGDIVIFRVPFGEKPRRYVRDGQPFEIPVFNRYQSVYVKRAVALSGEQVAIGEDGRLIVNDAEVAEPRIFNILRYSAGPPGVPEFDVRVREGEVLAFGDNTDNSQDSRYWDGIPYENLRGKAFMRYWPPRKMSFLE